MKPEMIYEVVYLRNVGDEESLGFYYSEDTAHKRAEELNTKSNTRNYAVNDIKMEDAKED